MWNKGGGTFMNFTAVVGCTNGGQRPTTTHVVANSNQQSAISTQQSAIKDLNNINRTVNCQLSTVNCNLSIAHKLLASFLFKIYSIRKGIQKNEACTHFILNFPSFR
jgi:hypothetical protein